MRAPLKTALASWAPSINIIIIIIIIEPAVLRWGKSPFKKLKFIVLFHVLSDLKRVFWSDKSVIKAS